LFLLREHLGTGQPSFDGVASLLVVESVGAQQGIAPELTLDAAI
jgi:hypothetical protein